MGRVQDAEKAKPGLQACFVPQCDPEMDIIQTLLNPENMLASVNKSGKKDFLNYFYKHCMHVFIGTDTYTCRRLC